MIRAVMILVVTIAIALMFVVKNEIQDNYSINNFSSILENDGRQLRKIHGRRLEALQTFNSEKVLTRSATSGPLINYLQSLFDNHHLDSFIMFLWDANGKLVKHSPIISHKPWIPDDVIREAYGQTTPSQYGKVGMIFNNDVVKMLESAKVPDPPIPIFLYTIPNDKIPVSNFHLIPTAYEVIGDTEVFVDSIKTYLGDSFLVSYEQFMQRKSIMVWRGAIHGQVEASRRIVVAINEAEKHRTDNRPEWIDATAALRLKSNYTPEVMIQNFRYHIDIGGVSGTSWGGLRWKMCGGGLVFKVNSWSKDLWHDTIQPWKHYIPVNDDLSNLREMYEWAEKNPTDAFRIAADGQQRCLETYTTQFSRNVLSKIVDDIQSSPEDIMSQAHYFFDHYLYSFLPEGDNVDNNKNNNNK